jgi:hypothetical protein
MANQIGKRYYCTKCGAEVIVTRGGCDLSSSSISKTCGSLSATPAFYLAKFKVVSNLAQKLPPDY